MATISNKKKTLFLIGPYPPPFGGVSIHIKRLIELLNNDYEILKIDESRLVKEKIFSLRSLRMNRYFRLVSKSDIVHIHSGHYFLRLLHFCVSKVLGKKLVITVHAYEEKSKTFIERKADRFIFKNSSKMIFVSEEISEKFSLPNAFIKQAFLPPIISDEPPLPSKIIEWINHKKDGEYFICSANASRLDVFDNQDLYGLDLCIEAAKRCVENNIKIAFVFVISDSDGELEVSHYRKLIDKYKLDDLFFIYDSSLSFIRLIDRSDIILRPTNTDGDALTVREGLFLGKKVIASDVAKRPQGTFLFRNRDIVSLMEIINKVNGELTKNIQPSRIEHERMPYKASEYLDFYRTNIYN